MITDAPSSREMEHRLSTLQTSLGMIERAITRYEDLIEDYRMQEEEACQEEEISLKQEEEVVNDAEMVDEEEHGDPDHSGPREVADTEGPFLWTSSKMLAPLPQHPLEMLSPPRRTPFSCSWHPNPEIQLLDLTVPGVRPVWSRERWLS